MDVNVNNNTDVTDEVLRDMGLENAQPTGTVVVQEDATVTIPNGYPRPSLTPADPTELESRDTIGQLANFNLESPNDVASSITTPSTQGEVSDLSDEETIAIAQAAIEDDHVASAFSVLDRVLNDDASVSDILNNETTEATTDDSRQPALPEIPDVFIVNDESTSRFSGAEWFKAVQATDIILAGVGGIGSMVLFILSRMKPASITIYDDDTVEAVNLAGQLYSSDMIGQAKVDAMGILARTFSNYYNVSCRHELYTADSETADIMICGFDNMEARNTFFHKWLDHVYMLPTARRKNCLFIDGRLSMEEMQVFSFTGDDEYSIRRYSSIYLFNDKEAESATCSMKQTAYCANMIGSIIVNVFTNFVANTLNPVIERVVPFRTYYGAALMNFKTEW